MFANVQAGSKKVAITISNANISNVAIKHFAAPEHSVSSVNERNEKTS